LVIVRILIGLINAILHVFVNGLLLLFSTLLTGLLTLAVIIGVVIGISATVGCGFFGRSRK
jgi:hypothetical protein